MYLRFMLDIKLTIDLILKHSHVIPCNMNSNDLHIWFVTAIIVQNGMLVCNTALLEWWLQIFMLLWMHETLSTCIPTHTLAAQKPCFTYILLNMQEDETSCKLQAAIISRLIITIIKQQDHEHQQWSKREWEGGSGRNRRVKKFYRVIHRSGFNRPISLIRLHPCIVGEDGKALTTGHARACVTVTLHWSLWLLSTSPWWCRPSS